MLTNEELDHAITVVDSIQSLSRILHHAVRVGDSTLIAETASLYDCQLVTFEKWVKESNDRREMYNDYVKLSWDHLDFCSQDVTYVVTREDDVPLWEHICTDQCGRANHWMLN